MPKKTGKPTPRTMSVTMDELAELVDTFELDVEEMETFDRLGINLAELATGKYPNVLFAGLVWLKLRREGDPDLTWDDARKFIRVSR